MIRPPHARIAAGTYLATEDDAMNETTLEGTLYIGSGVIAKGRLTVPSAATINGTVEGELSAQSLRIMSSGVVDGTATAEEIVVAGRMDKSATATRLLVIESTGVMHGQIACGELEIRKGGELHGKIEMLNNKA
jgi:cytoskeletal protein CcmA (bactofilin family)